MEVPNYMQTAGRRAQPRSDRARRSGCVQDAGWEPDWEEFERAVTPGTRLLYLSNPNNPTGSVLSESSMRRIVERCEQTGTMILADEVYLGAEIDRPPHAELLGNERSGDRDERPVEGLRHSQGSASAGSSARRRWSRSAGRSTTT